MIVDSSEDGLLELTTRSARRVELRRSVSIHWAQHAVARASKCVVLRCVTHRSAMMFTHEMSMYR